MEPTQAAKQKRPDRSSLSSLTQEPRMILLDALQRIADAQVRHNRLGTKRKTMVVIEEVEDLQRTARLAIEAWTKEQEMDPQACIERIRIAYGSNDWDELANATDDLQEWLADGGFAPQSLTQPQLSAFTLMVRQYAENQVTRMADGTTHDHKNDYLGTA